MTEQDPGSSSPRAASTTTRIPMSFRTRCARKQLTELARELGRHEAVHDRIMDAYWSEAQDIGNVGVLRGLAARAGAFGGRHRAGA